MKTNKKKKRTQKDTIVIITYYFECGVSYVKERKRKQNNLFRLVQKSLSKRVIT